MAPDPIISWELDGETVTDFIFWVSKITAEGDCSHEIKRRRWLFPAKFLVILHKGDRD